MSQPTFVAKRFLVGAAGDMINADHIVRIFINGDKLFAAMTVGADLELVTQEPITSPAQTPERLFRMVSI
jgi:hypothetical protein